MNHQFHHSMTHNKTPPPKKSNSQKCFPSANWKRSGSQLLNLTSFAPLLPPLLANPPSSSAAHPAAGVWLPCLCPGLVRCGGWSSMGSTAHAHSLAFKGRSSCCCWLAHWDPQCWAQCVQKKAAPSDQKHVWYNVCRTTISLYRSILAFRDILYNGFEE